MQRKDTTFDSLQSNMLKESVASFQWMKKKMIKWSKEKARSRLWLVESPSGAAEGDGLSDQTFSKIYFKKGRWLTKTCK